MSNPTFTTQRLVLTSRSEADTEACMALDHEPGVTRFVDGPWNDPAAHRAFIEARTQGPYPTGLGYWTIRAKDAPEVFLGWALLIPVDAIGPAIEIGWRLSPAAWGHGYAVEAARALLTHGFDALGLREIIAEIDPANTASIRVAEKLGMQRGETFDGAARPWVRYSLQADSLTVTGS
jgi:RimJ/RimL family protein N-acetyltransferase